MIINIIGQPEAGKTTVANELRRRIKEIAPSRTVIIIDGDKYRAVYRNTDYSTAGRQKNISTAYDLARSLIMASKVDASFSPVIILAMVSPFEDLRKGLDKWSQFQFSQYFCFYLYSDREQRKKFHVTDYPIPGIGEPAWRIDTDINTLDATVTQILLATKFQTTTMHKQYSMFVGRWQPWHEGHRWLIDQRLDLGKNVLICIRDVAPDAKNIFTPEECKGRIETALGDLITEGRVKVMIIPDIESINYGRSVGYEVIEHVPPADISAISATAIREGLGNDKPAAE